MKTIYTFVLLLFGSLALYSQDLDIHFSQFYHAALHHNPALTGAFAQDVRFAGIYRRQWQSVPVPYMTVGAAVDSKFPIKAIRPGLFSAGAIFSYDESGDAELTFSQVGLTASYAHPLDDYNTLSIGFQVGGGQRSLQIDNLQFGTQFNGDIYDPDLPHQENFQTTNTGFFDISTGLNWHYRNDAGIVIDAGGAAYHLNRPKISFFDDNHLAWKMLFNTYAIGSVKVGSVSKMRIFALAQLQGPSMEVVAGGSFHHIVNPAAPSPVQLGAGIGTRIGDAIIPTAEVNYGAWTVAFSYDINISDFEIATNGKGGPEIAAIYTITRVRPPEVFESCPVF